MKKILLVLLAVAAMPVSAEQVDINIGAHSARVALQGPIERVIDAKGVYDLGLLTRRDSPKKLYQGHAGLLLSGDVGARDAAIQAGVGARFLITDVEPGSSGSALAIGGQVEGRIPQLVRLGFLAHVYGAPSATSFSNLDSYVEYAVALDYQIIRQASLYGGYRQVHYKLNDSPSITVDNGLHLGVRLNF